MNTELAALAYLAIKTEHIAKHTQYLWYDAQNEDGFAARTEDEVCKTSGCIAGHICIIEEGKIFRTLNESSNKEWTTDATKYLSPDEYLDFRAIRELRALFYNNSDPFFESSDYRLEDGKSANERAIILFPQWVKRWSTDEEWETFQRIVNIEDYREALEESEYEDVYE